MPTSSSTIRISAHCAIRRRGQAAIAAPAVITREQSSVTRAPRGAPLASVDASARARRRSSSRSRGRGRCPSALVVTYGSKACSSTSSGNPGPASPNDEHAPRRRGAASAIAKRGSGDIGLGIDRVLQEVVEHLAQARGLALDDDRRIREASARRAAADCRTERARRARGRPSRPAASARTRLRARRSRNRRPCASSRRPARRSSACRASASRWSAPSSLRASLTREPLGGELDRRQRILDLVREPARDLGPRGVALRLHELGHVVEHDDIARDGASRQPRPAHQQRARQARPRRAAPRVCHCASRPSRKPSATSSANGASAGRRAAPLGKRHARQVGERLLQDHARRSGSRCAGGSDRRTRARPRTGCRGCSPGTRARRLRSRARDSSVLRMRFGELRGHRVERFGRARRARRAK